MSKDRKVKDLKKYNVSICSIFLFSAIVVLWFRLIANVIRVHIPNVKKPLEKILKIDSDFLMFRKPWGTIRTFFEFRY